MKTNYKMADAKAANGNHRAAKYIYNEKCGCGFSERDKSLGQGDYRNLIHYLNEETWFGTDKHYKDRQNKMRTLLMHP